MGNKDNIIIAFFDCTSLTAARQDTANNKHRATVVAQLEKGRKEQQGGRSAEQTSPVPPKKPQISELILRGFHPVENRAPLPGREGQSMGSDEAGGKKLGVTDRSFQASQAKR